MVGVGQALGGSAQPQLPTLSTPARTTGLSESPGQAVVLGGPCVQFVKCYLKRDYNPATDTPTESSDRGAGRAHFGSTRTERWGGGCDWWGVPWVFKDSKTGPRKSSRRVSEELLTIRQIRLSREGDAGRTAVGMATSADTDERVCRS